MSHHQIKALSVRQPWASLIASGRKTLEIRSRRTHFRGTIAICASAAPEKRSWADPWRAHAGPLGVVVATVEIVDCRLATADDAEAACVAPPEGSYAWVLANARPACARRPPTRPGNAREPPSCRSTLRRGGVCGLR